MPLTMGQIGTAGLKDDAAVIVVPDGHELVVTSDTLNEGVHFLSDSAPEDIARKALRVNLSDVAAMGAAPLCYQLNLAFPTKPSEDWLARFSGALLSDNALYGVYCSAGDTTSIQGAGLSISITAMGAVPVGQAVRRSGAQDGDVLVVTGAVGDAALGLQMIRAGAEDDYAGAVARYYVPQPRCPVVDIVRKYANAASDISDGLLADAMHIARASGLGVEIDPSKLIFSKDVQHALDDGVFDCADILSGGDDYELILAVSSDCVDGLISELRNCNLNPMVIGEFKGDILGFYILDTVTKRIDVKSLGWKHF